MADKTGQWISGLGDILGLGTLLGGLFGGGPSGAQKQAQEQANTYGKMGANDYMNLQEWGQADRNTFMNNFGNYLSQYLYSAGVPGGTWAGNNQGSVVPMQGGIGGTRIPNQQPGSQTAQGQGGAGRIPQQTAQGNQNQAPGGGGVPMGQGQGNAGSPIGGTPYDLTQAQQVQLNAQVSQINRQMQSAISEYTAEVSRQGQQPNPAAIEQIRESFAAQAEQSKANFAESARSAREQALAATLSMYLGIGQQGTGELEAGAAGLSNLATGQQNQANTQQAIGSQQNAALLQLAGYLLGGGIRQPGTPNLGPAQSTPAANDPNSLFPTGLTPTTIAPQWL